MKPPEFRRDPVVGRWIIVASERRNRPRDSNPPVKPPADSEKCPFCPGSEEMTTAESASKRGPQKEWLIRSFPSSSPVADASEELVRRGEGMFDMMSGYGMHEVIVNTPSHTDDIGSMTQEDVHELLLFWRRRCVAMKKEDQIRYLTLFANKGARAGAHIEHSHSQIVATPTIPRRVSEELAMCYSYFQSKERCVFCDILEGDASQRLVYQNEHVAVITPFASRFPYEMWILPREHASHFEEFEESHAWSLAEGLRLALLALRRALDDPPYSLVLHTAPTHEKGMVHYHWHIEIMPRLTQPAGFEWGTGFYINPVPPEEASEVLRDCLAR